MLFLFPRRMESFEFASSFKISKQDVLIMDVMIDNTRKFERMHPEDKKCLKKHMMGLAVLTDGDQIKEIKKYGLLLADDSLFYLSVSIHTL